MSMENTEPALLGERSLVSGASCQTYYPQLRGPAAAGSYMINIAVNE